MSLVEEGFTEIGMLAPGPLSCDVSAHALEQHRRSLRSLCLWADGNLPAEFCHSEAGWGP